MLAGSSRWVVRAARIGYSAKALVYATVGTLAVMAASGIAGGKLTDNRGALRALGKQPFGTALLWTSAFGLLCYAVWNGVRAGMDPEHKGTGVGALFARAGYGVSTAIHLLLALYAAQLAMGTSPGGGQSQTYVGKLLHYTPGVWLLGIAGLVLVGFGVVQAVKAAKGKVGHQYAHAPLGKELCRTVRTAARVGTLARGMVFMVIGVSFVTAAMRRDPGEADGFAEALRKLAHTPLGVGLLYFVSLGLLAYATHLLFVARWGAFAAPR